MKVSISLAVSGIRARVKEMVKHDHASMNTKNNEFFMSSQGDDIFRERRKWIRSSERGFQRKTQEERSAFVRVLYFQTSKEINLSL
jgi:hypothetical protein